MNILFIGDIVGKPGRRAISKMLPGLKKKLSLDTVIANGENAAGGLGITPEIMDELISCGIDIITSGNHIWKKKDIFERLELKTILRPANYPDDVPGSGYSVYNSGGIKVAVINLLGRIFMDPVENPFSIVDSLLSGRKKEADIIIVDLHAEATSEKVAMGWFLDGRVSAVLGTHTHVQTADEQVLPGGTAYISDVGMTGSHSGVIGVEKDEILKYFTTNMPFSYKSCTGPGTLNAVLMDIDESDGRARSIERISIKEDVQ